MTTAPTPQAPVPPILDPEDPNRPGGGTTDDPDLTPYPEPEPEPDEDPDEQLPRTT
ncbi:hypothetical protein [Kribbella soli]|uniref:hypothetical protein n=1 Tax=Kribbella soli TaxID=1124743 RepID=UPI0013F496E3|nr:hypothetical protein [Kribbella soli]